MGAIGLDPELLNTVHCMDCLEFMKGLPDGCVDLVITSPPYNKNGYRGKKVKPNGKGRWRGSDISYGDYEDDMLEEQYKDRQVSILDEFYRIIKQGGSIFYNHKERRSNGKASNPYEWIVKTKANYYQEIIWDRLGRPDQNVNYMSPKTEKIYRLTKGKPLCKKDECYFKSDIWGLSPEINTEHPAPFPIFLIRNIISLSSTQGGIVLDCFAGSGTTGVACKELGRNYILVEKEPKYVDIIHKRLQNTTVSLFHS